MKTRILVADDHELLRDTLVCYLQTEDEFEIDCVGDFPEAAAAVENGGDYDLILLDFNMPGMIGLNSLVELLKMKGGQRVALISGVASVSVATEAIRAGASGFLPKTLSARGLVTAVKQMVEGELFLPEDIRDEMEAETPTHILRQLSRREFQVWQALAKGKSNKEIARDLDVRETTIKLHVKTLYRKIGVANRTQAAVAAMEAGVLMP